MSIPDFLRTRLVGKRFEDHSIPLEILRDLAELEPMVIEVAKWLYLKDHLNRERSPRGFTDGVSLRLAAVEEGSVVAKITLSLGMSTLLFSLQQDYVERARDAVVNAIDAAAQNKPPTEYLPQKGLAYFDRLGRSLRDDEAIEFSSLEQTHPARLTKETRRRLLKAAEVMERTEDVPIRGGIHELNQDNMTFEIKLYDGSKIPGEVGEQHLEQMLMAHNQYEKGKGLKVRLDIVGKFNRNDRLEKIESVEHITFLEPLDFRLQLDELRTLKDGWYDGMGQAPPASGLDWLAESFDEYDPDISVLPYVYPVPEGGVRLEWTIGPYEATLEIDLNNRKGDWHLLSLETNEDEERSLELDNKDDWSWMAKRLQALSGATP